MFYILPEWLNNENNMSLVYDILNQYIGSDLNPDPKSAIKELKAIGEVGIIDKLNKGYLKCD